MVTPAPFAFMARQAGAHHGSARENFTIQDFRGTGETNPASDSRKHTNYACIRQATQAALGI